jgi:catechol 2,3-dioxygenase-like lactoylglutathione lyase family enzyme
VSAAGAPPRFSPPKIAQVELHVRDLAEAKAFYCGVLGLEAVGEFGDSLFVRCGETNLIIQASPDPKPSSVVYFSADGCVPEATEALSAQGVRFSEVPRRIARNHQGVDVWLGFFADPAGNRLALIANMPVEAA